MKCALAALALLAATAPAAAKKAAVPLPALVQYGDAKIHFSYPKGWGSLVLEEDGSRAGALSEDASSRLIIEARVVESKDGLRKLLRERVPRGSDHPQGRWQCRWGNLEDGSHTTFCGRPSTTRKDEVLVVGITSSPDHFQLYFHQLIIKIGDSVLGFHATRDD